MVRSVVVRLFAVFVVGTLAACGDSDGDTQGPVPDALFAVEDAEALAHAAMLDSADLPGDGWEVTAMDDFDDEDDGEFEEAMQNEPACSTISALSGLGGIFEDDDDELPAGRAKVEFENATLDPRLPVGIKFEVEIEETVSEVQAGWGLAQEVIESEDFGACMLAVLPTAFAGEDMPEGTEIDVSLRDPSASAPNEGASMGFDMDIAVGTVQLELAIEMYMWPYGNAGISALFLGSRDALDSELIDSTLVAFDRKVIATAS